MTVESDNPETLWSAWFMVRVREIRIGVSRDGDLLRQWSDSSVGDFWGGDYADGSPISKAINQNLAVIPEKVLDALVARRMARGR